MRGPASLVTMEAFRGRTYLGAIHDMCPELATATPGALRSVRLPELTAVITIDERRHDGVLRWAELSAPGGPRVELGGGDRAEGGRAHRRGPRPLHVGLHGDPEGRDARARRRHRQRLRHRRAPAPHRGRSALAVRAALLVVRLGQRAAGDPHPRRHARASGELRARRGARAARPRAVQRLLRHGQHGPRHARASRPRAPRAGGDAHRAHHRPARGRRDDDGGGQRARAVQCLRLDRDVR